MSSPKKKKPEASIPLLPMISALHRVLPAEHPADAVLSHFFRTHPKLGMQDRHQIAETIFAILRRYHYLHALIAPYDTPRALVLAALVKLRGTPLKALEHHLRIEEKTWLAELKTKQVEFCPPEDLPKMAELPDFAVDIMRQAAMSDDKILAIGRGMQRPAALDLRVNSFKNKRDAVLAQLQAEGLDAQAGKYSPFAIRVRQKTALNRHPLFLSGDFEVQDEGSQLLSLLLAPKRGEMVVDFCAGAGGKTLHLGALMHSTGRLYAFDVSEKRLAKLKPRLARSGLSNVHPQRIDSERDTRIKRLAGKIDRVFVDAPCSGFGTLRRNPDLKLRQNAASLTELNRLQASILQSAASLLKIGGRLVYATCSILPSENEAIVRQFLQQNPHFQLENAHDILRKQGVDLGRDSEFLQLSAHEFECDGFFAAVLSRTT